MNGQLLISIIFPILAGFILLLSSFFERLRCVRTGDGGTAEVCQGGDADRVSAGDGGNLRDKGLHAYVGIALFFSVALVLGTAWAGNRALTLFTLLDKIPVYFCIDGIGRFFVTIVSLIWLAAGIFAFSYLRKDRERKRYYGFYLILYGVLTGLDFSGNLITMYLFYELVTLISMPLVLHEGTREAIMAALKYLFYSMCGAYAGLFGIFFLYRYCDSLSFTAGGTLNAAAVQGQEGILLIAVFVMIIGFATKAGMMPLHAWLPAAHPVAPSPASAVFSAIIVKSGVLAIIRAVYYIVGPDFVRGTWVQYTWLTLALLTVFMGSMLAFREKVFKKRLAYSTVSQISYILFGLFLLTPTAMTGALLHTAAHALIKCGLFLTAGVFVYQFGCTRVEQLTGMGKRMPKTMWCYTFFSLALIGIPPMNGFVSKWYLAEGALQSGIGVFSWLGPAALLVSALLTAGYLLPIVTAGFFPGEEGDGLDFSKKEPPSCMLLPLLVLAALVVLCGIFPNPLIDYFAGIAVSVLQ